MASNDVCVEAIDFAYGRRIALRGVTLRLTPGVTGLLGPNGAGKSTLMNVLASLAAPRSGRVLIGGRDLADAQQRQQARARVGHLPQRFSVAGRMTVRQHVEYSAWTHGVADADCADAAARAMSVVDLVDLAGQRARTLSGGQRQRMGIACAIAHEPSVLLLDEPTVGLDPLQRVQVRRFLHRIGQQAMVLVSTHLVDDVAQIADRLVVLLDGEIAFQGSVTELASRSGIEYPYLSSLEAGYQDLVLATGTVA